MFSAESLPFSECRIPLPGGENVTTHVLVVLRSGMLGAMLPFFPTRAPSGSDAAWAALFVMCKR